MSSTLNGVTETEWNDVRNRFKGSMMAKTEIGKLAQNIGASWPLKGAEEIPLKYLPLTLDELMMCPGIGDRPERIRLLIEILNETMAFDDPFSEMADHVDSASKSEDRPRRVLEQLEVPLDYPLRLCALSPETQAFCQQEEIETLGQFAELSQKMAQTIVVGGDFRGFLNTMAHPEETSIARYIPLRPGKKGLHLAEALGQQVEQLTAAESRFFRTGGKREAESEDDGERLGPHARAEAEKVARSRVQELVTWFSEDAERLRSAFVEGPSSVERFFVVLDNPEKEAAAAGLARLVLAPEQEKAPCRGLWSRLFRR